MKRKITNIIIIILAALFVLSAAVIAYHYISQGVHERRFRDMFLLAPPISETENDDTPAIEFYNSLYSQNADTAAYLTIPGAQINYPVMSTPENMEYYIRRDFEGNYSYYGTPFFDTRVQTDGGVKIIYGHHIRGEKMFGELLNYSDYDFFNSHNKIHLYTQNGDEVYNVLAAFYTTEDDPGDFYARAIRGLYSDNEYISFLNDVRNSAVMYDKILDPQPGDEILMLSTCEYSHENGRYVVVAVKIN